MPKTKVLFKISWKYAKLLQLTLATVFCSVAVGAEPVVLKPTEAPKSFGKIPPLADHQTVDFAVYPQISFPTAVIAEPNGAVLVFEDRNAALNKDPHKGRIVRLIDHDHDGRADQLTEFVPDLDSPRGGCFVNGTLYVMHPPYVSSFRDTNNDGVADERKILVKGVGFDLTYSRGADHTSNDARMGIDGWLYLAIGDFGATAVGADGAKVTLHGGGMLRVRPDGSALSLVTEGTRNIYDVAVSPRLDIIARDNTNDGGGWDMRVHHLTPLAHMGYPNLFRNFPEDAMPPMVQDGGGSGVGALFLQEPGFPDWINNRFLTISWGKLYTHELTPHEATFTNADKVVWPYSKLLELDVDGSSSLYAAIFSNGSARPDGKEVGRIVRVVPDDWTYKAFPELNKLPVSGLLAALRSPSQVMRLNAQQELLSRHDPSISGGLTTIAQDKSATLDSRIAALFALRQHSDIDAFATFEKLYEDATIREYALRALIDRTDSAKKLSPAFWAKALADPDPRVRLQAIVGIVRAEAKNMGSAVLPLASENTPRTPLKTGQSLPHDAIPHTARRALMFLGDAQTCLSGLTQSNLRSAALATLRLMHTAQAVDGVIAALAKETNSTRRLDLLIVLMRLYHDEKTWDSQSWWGTRPDTSGPYFEAISWDKTPAIQAAINQYAATLAVTEQNEFVTQLRRHRIPLGDLKLTISVDLFDSLMQQKLFTDIDVPALQAIINDQKRSLDQRKRAFHAFSQVQKMEYRKWHEKGLTLISDIGEKEPELARWMCDDYVLAPMHRESRVTWIGSALEEKKPNAWKTRAVAAILLNQHQSPLSSASEKKQITSLLNAVTLTPTLVQVIGETQSTAFTDLIEQAKKSTDVTLRKAGELAAVALTKPKAEGDEQKSVSSMTFEQVQAKVMTMSGDAQQGSALFMRQSCVVCHTLRADEPQRGPYLGTVGQQFSREKIIEHILKPNAEVAQGFQTTYFEKKDGTLVEGFVSARDNNAIEVRNIVGGITSVATSEVVKEGLRPRSMMPEGLVNALTLREFASLVDYLQTLH